MTAITEKDLTTLRVLAHHLENDVHTARTALKEADDEAEELGEEIKTLLAKLAEGDEP